MQGPWHYIPEWSPGCRVVHPELVLIRGAVGSGKTKLARTFTQTHVHVETDHYFLAEDGGFYIRKDEQRAAHVWVLRLCAGLLGSGRNVVVANTFALNEWMVPYFAVAREHGSLVRVFKTPQETAFHIQRYLYSIEPLRIPDEGLVINEGIASAETRTSHITDAYSCQPFSCNARVGDGYSQRCQMMQDALTKPPSECRG